MDQKFCGNCGTPVTGRFCTNCGQPTGLAPQAGQAAPQAPVQDQATSAPPPPVAATPGYVPGGAETSSPRTSPTNPLAGLSPADLVRDGAAVFLLFASLALPWDVLNDGADRWWVVIATVLGAVAVALPYLGRTGLVPGWGPPQVRLAKVALLAPYGVSVLAALLNELINVGDYLGGGMGPGLAMGLAGALLALQPREYDDQPGAHDRTWWSVFRALGWTGLVAMVLTWLVWLLRELVGGGYLIEQPLTLVGHVFQMIAILGVAIGLPLVLASVGSRPWLRVMQVVAFTTVGLNLLAAGGDGNGAFVSTGMEKLDVPMFGLFLLVAAAAVSLARPVDRVVDRVVARVVSWGDDAAIWVSTASHALLVTALGLALWAVADVLAMIEIEDFSANRIISLVLTVAAVGAAIAALSLLDRSPDRSRLAVLSILGAIAVAGVVATAVAGTDGDARLDAFSAVFWFTAPGLAAYSLLVPASVRSTFTPLASTSGPETSGPETHGPETQGPTQG